MLPLVDPNGLSSLLAADAPAAIPALWSFASLMALLTLTAMEVVLGIDNLVFIAVVAGRLPPERRDRARQVGLMLAVGVRIGLLLAITWIMELKKPWFNLLGHQISGKEFILIAGGLFLIYKSTKEIHHKVEHVAETSIGHAAVASFGAVIGQILVIDAVFSLDSVITAVGMVPHKEIMIVAIIISIAIMLAFSKSVTDFVNRHPAVKILALSFLLLIGVMLVAEGFEYKIPKGYIYFAMAFSLMVELLQMRMSRRGHSATLPASNPLTPSTDV